jgi:hypothetical protein
MHDFVKTVHGNQPQPPAHTKQMGPPPQPVDPRLVAQVLQQMQHMGEAPMSRSDSVVIHNRPEPQAVVVQGDTDPFQAQAIEFSRSPVGQVMIHGNQACGYQSAEHDEQLNALIRQKTAEVLATAMGYGNPNDMGTPYGGY